MLLLRPPGVYAPQGDTSLLSDALAETGVAPGARVLDLCTGSGALALEALRMGAHEVRAYDTSPWAVLTTRCNAFLRRVPLSTRRGGVDEALGRSFDVVLANPPYVPSPDPELPRRGRARAWDAGPDGRAVLDPLCDRARLLLAPGGTMLLVHSAMCGTEATLDRLRRQGLEASVAQRRLQPFGPVLRGRADWLEAQGLIDPGQRTEELVVVRGDRSG
ncbi:class I SAM-dependent methyltransferase [Streptomyces sp. ACA25]|uniref:HemK2/MTQ2 family protein methyltransferase n=1 Tax=Streptomyces sp. ACA25 TaxID=3022596 RepID=UPI0023073AF6|nr:HemK2/MTQ2 family protein methyltransferase [Streptomyces sp. ACA25]MDB1090064.1 class I SAM-dependent methyltransferase [Streptomyces sp. ACA25]